MNHTSQNTIKSSNKPQEKSHDKKPSRQDYSKNTNKKSNRKVTRSDFQIASDIARFKKIRLNRELPIAEKAAEIQELLAENQVLIVAGETGCGKTTQLPQICLQAGLGIKKQIAHTQPRRVAATSVANRIASELKTELGNEVGYAVRFSDRTSENTRIKLMTDGVLLAELQSDPLLRRYEVIIIDEAHERSLNIDFLLGFLQQVLQKRKDLKLIVTSATIDPVKFSNYFNNAPMIQVEGRTYPVEVVYQPRGIDGEESGSLEESVVQAINYCIAKSTGDILIFSHGEAEIRQLSKFIQKQNYSQLIVLPLYARLGIKEQQAIFSASNKRKIIIATNVAETSLTIPNILFVIDIGLARISRYSQRNKIQQLPIEKISQASANQRKGRSGRIAPGICIRLYDEEDFDNRPEYTEPEIKRTNLSSVVLRLKALGVANVEDFPFIQMPNERQWKVAFNLLFEIGGMDEDKQITAIGRKMSRLPLDPQLSRILLDRNNQAFEEMLIVTSFLGVRDVRIRPPKEAAKGAQQKADVCHKAYQDENSDILSIINLWNFLNKQRELTSNSKFKRWCLDNFINFVGWLEWRNTYFQIKDEIKKLESKGKKSFVHDKRDSHNPNKKSATDCKKIGVEKTTASLEQIHRALIPGFISHLMMKTSEGHYQGARGLKVWTHPSSALFSKKPLWLLSMEMVETNKLYARSNVPVKPEWFEDSASHLLKDNFQDIHWRKSKGCVAAYLNQSLFGLPIVNKRLIDYGKIEPKLGRELFLKEGLVENAINVKFPFLDNNQSIVDRIKLEEEKLRRNDLLLDADAFAALYQELIPENIINVYKLKRWLKKDWQARNKRLCFSEESLKSNQTEKTKDYPSDIYVKGVMLPVSYRFAPGQAEDGIHVSIPVEMLSQFQERDFEWLVPGYLKDKIIATLKSLPKPIRKQLIPIADTAQLCLDYLTGFDYAERDYKKTLQESLLRTKAFELSVDQINTDDLPSHLKMKYVALNSSKNRNEKYYSDLSSIKKNYAGNHSSSTNNINANSKHSEALANQHQLTRWPEDDFKIEELVNKSGRELRLFNAITDCENYVVVKQYPSLVSALDANNKGVCRLIQIENKTLIKEFNNSWPERREIEKLTLRFGGFSNLLDWIVCTNALQIISSAGARVESKGSYEQVQVMVSRDLRSRVANDLNAVIWCLKSTQKIYLHMSQLKSEVYQASISDISAQLKKLWSSESFTRKGARVFSDYKRYLEGVESRLVRIEENFPRESQLMQDWLEWVGWWKELEQEYLNFEASEQLWKVFWMLEEYRLSLFTLNIKIDGKISAKKLQKAFDKVESLAR